MKWSMLVPLLLLVPGAVGAQQLNTEDKHFCPVVAAKSAHDGMWRAWAGPRCPTELSWCQTSADLLRLRLQLEGALKPEDNVKAECLSMREFRAFFGRKA